MNLITAIERIPPSDLVSDELDLLLKRTQRGLVVLEQVGAMTDRQLYGSIHTTHRAQTLVGYACMYSTCVYIYACIISMPTQVSVYIHVR